MNFTAVTAREEFGMRAFIKVHCSTDQSCPDIPDPRTGKPLNFNFLPAYASPDLGVMPHSVQLPSFDDPAGNVYGNLDFSDLFDFAVYMTNQTKPWGMDTERAELTGSSVGRAPSGREIIWHSETGYWVNYDIDSSLALGTLYGERRLSDLRRLGSRIASESKGSLDGQNIFDSGWEYGYWQGAVLAARAVWNPMFEATSQDAAFQSLFSSSIASSLYGATGAGGAAGAQAATTAFSQIANDQRAAFLFGASSAPKGSPPSK